MERKQKTTRATRYNQGMWHEKIHRVLCSDDPDHLVMLSPSELEDLIDSGEYKCEEVGCDGVLELDFDRTDGDLELLCHVCEMTFPVSTLEEATMTISHGCETCRQIREFPGDSVHVHNSLQEAWDEYKWSQQDQAASPILVAGRKDYWEGLTHFCGIEEFISIWRDSAIKASPTGYFNVPAVCLSDATAGNWRGLQETHGAFGFLFRKRHILKLGGAPVMYMPPQLIRAQKRMGFSSVVKPFVTKLSTRSNAPDERRHDYLHEREWRVPRDIEFGQCKPFAVLVDWEQVSHDVEDWQAIFEAARYCQELELPVERVY